MKGDAGSPIWIVVTLLLALVVGITMYQLLRTTQATETFQDWYDQIGSGKAELELSSFCNSWERAGFSRAVNEKELAKASVAAAHESLAVQYFTRDEFNLGERLSPCDCAVFLNRNGEMDLLEAENWYDPDECHSLANDIAESTGLTRSSR